jgi:putative ABC transport system permease protein
VVGIFEAGKTAYESEIWADADEVRDAFNRNFYGSALIRPVSAEDGAVLKETLEKDRVLSVRVLPEIDYYKDQTATAGPIQFMGGFLATIMSIGAAFSAMNTMYAAVGARTREIGTLRVLGFKRRSIYGSFLIESVLLAGLGGLLGCLLSLPLNGVATGTFSFTSFAEVAFEFRITPELLGKGMVFALVMGVLGGLLPARLAARKPVLEALKA